MKAMVHSPNGDSDFVGIITEVLPKDTLILFLF